MVILFLVPKKKKLWRTIWVWIYSFMFSEALWPLLSTIYIKYKLQNRNGKELQPQRNDGIFDPMNTFVSALVMRNEGISRTVWLSVFSADLTSSSIFLFVTIYKQTSLIRQQHKRAVVLVAHSLPGNDLLSEMAM